MEIRYRVMVDLRSHKYAVYFVGGRVTAAAENTVTLTRLTNG